jgi:uncharacterized membrane protein SpoIIM required for sporulation
MHHNIFVVIFTFVISSKLGILVYIFLMSNGTKRTLLLME